MHGFRRFLAVCTLSVAFLGCPAPDTSDPSAARGVPDEVVRHNVLGTAYLGQQKWTEAEEAFGKALAERPEDPLLLNNLAVAQIQQGRIDEAEALLRRALQAETDHPYAHYNLGLIEKNRGNFEPAVEHFEAVAAYDPDDLLTQYNLGIVYSRIDRADAAEAAFRRALERNPAHVSSLYGLGRHLLQQGQREEGARLIALSQEIRSRSGLDEAVGSQYGEQGPYAMGVDYPGDALVAPAAITVRFAAGPTIESAADARTLTRLTPGDRVAALWGAGGGIVALTAQGRVPLELPKAVEGEIRDLAAGDVDNDGIVDLALVVASGESARRWVLRQDAEGRFATLGEPTAVAPGSDLLFVDSDHDGDLDLFSCWPAGASPSGCGLAANDGSGSFLAVAADAHRMTLADARAPVRVALSDYDNDRDIDLLAFEAGGLHVFDNQRDGSFEEVSARIGLDPGPAAVADVAVADVNKDGWMDLVVAGPDGIDLWANGPRGFATPLRVAEGAADGLVVFDHDNDGFLDVVAHGAESRLYRNTGAGGWREVTGALDTLGGAAPVAAFDADGDGDLDLLAAGATASGLWLNEGGNAYGWIAVDSRGVGDNKFGIGSKVEILAGALRQKFELVDPLPLHAGLGEREAVDSVRYLWPSGVLQDEIEQPAGAVAELEQLDRKGTSCPLLYAWEDGAWRFVTDFLGGAAVGYQLAPGHFNMPDTDEYVRLPRGLTPDADDIVRVRMNNQLEEVLWFDQVELVAVDHPVGTEVFPNEALMPGPPWPAFRLFVSDDLRPPLGARWVESGVDWTDALGELDRRYADGFALLPFKGYAEPHTLELDFGELPANESIVLLMDGWIDYADSSSNVAAAQAGVTLLPPRLSLPDGTGGWRAAQRRVGFPAGLPKTMTLDLTGLLDSTHAKLRIETSMRIYWDRVRVLVGDRSAQARLQRLSPLAAELRDGGFPREVSPDGARPMLYDPERVRPYGSWKAHVGRYTGFGDVTTLLAARDDRFVTTRNGDEIELSFRTPAPPEPGFTRSWLVFADGFGKDMDPNSAANTEVGPVPFHGMPSYPYPETVTPPDRGPAEASASRRVLPSAAGWPGARPQVLAARGD